MPNAENGIAALTGSFGRLGMANWAGRLLKKTYAAAKQPRTLTHTAHGSGASEKRVPLLIVQGHDGIITPCPQGGADPYYYALVFTTNPKSEYAAGLNLKVFIHYALQESLEVSYSAQTDPFLPQAIDVKAKLIDFIGTYTYMEFDECTHPNAFANFIFEQIQTLRQEELPQTMKTPMFQTPAIVKAPDEGKADLNDVDLLPSDSLLDAPSKTSGIVINRRAFFSPRILTGSSAQQQQSASAIPTVVEASKATLVAPEKKQVAAPSLSDGVVLEVLAQAMVMTLASGKLARTYYNMLVKMAFASGVLQFVRANPPQGR
ncbi:hypothetical protein H4R35_002539 [Dimargaris xerosporica]|nr:hypothetical protein H4R35_002539 [Dimargaris xerosporica]